VGSIFKTSPKPPVRFVNFGRFYPVFAPLLLLSCETAKSLASIFFRVSETQEESKMAKLSKFHIAPLIAFAMVTTAANAQQTAPPPQETPPPAQAPAPTDGALLGGQLGTQVAIGAAVAVGLAVALAGDDDDTVATTTTTTR
jgi:hypothetical protein